MSDENKNKPERKKSFPFGFLIFLVASILILLSLQGFQGEKRAKVGFSHQLEHLVNLDLLQSDESRKVALNDHLVTFFGKFKDRLSDDAKGRYRYLELLNQEHLLRDEKDQIGRELDGQRQTVVDASTLFLKLTGEESAPYTVVPPSNDSNAIIITQHADPANATSLAALQKRYQTLKSANGAALDAFQSDLLTLIHGFRSPQLGLGSEPMKQEVRALEQQVTVAAHEERSARLTTYGEALTALSHIVTQISAEEEGFRLLLLRSVRSYRANLSDYEKVETQLSKITVQLTKAREGVSHVIWYFNNQELSTKALERQDPEVFAHWYAQAKQEWDAYPQNHGMVFKAPDQPRNTVLEKSFKSEEPAPNYLGYLLPLLPLFLIIALLYFGFARQMKGVGSGAMSFGKSPARLLTKERNKVTFKDVAGCEEAKEELQEIVDFLKEPSKFTALGACIPKGVLCVGAPGTGKTLIAKAVAGEADRPFFFISGSDFVEMFVGVGASRIRDLFDQAKKSAPCIIFMDEIDAVGRHRGAGIGGGHDEREQTLNQLLVEMDGFDSTEGVILIAATNRPDVLDKALLRPGRFDRRIVIDLPDIRGRFEIVKVHARKVKLEPNVDLMYVARNTPGASGADLRNILNEAALLAARRNRKAVGMTEIAEACDKVRYGKERRSLEIDKGEKRTTAIHEAGHAIVALKVEHADPIDKVTIIPRGLSLGATHFMPEKNRLSYWKKELHDQLAVLMGGRAAEEVFVGDTSSGAQMDFSQATRLAHSMVCEWGMTEELGTVAYDERADAGQYLGQSNYIEKHLSEKTSQEIDDVKRRLLNEAHERAIVIVQENRATVQLMADMLVEFETLDKDDVLEIFHGTWDAEKKRAKLRAYEASIQPATPPPPPAARDLRYV